MQSLFNHVVSAEWCVLYWALLLARDLVSVLSLLFWFSNKGFDNISHIGDDCPTGDGDARSALVNSTQLKKTQAVHLLCQIGLQATFKPMVWAEADRKRAILLSCSGPETFRLARRLASPRVLNDYHLTRTSRDRRPLMMEALTLQPEVLCRGRALCSSKFAAIAASRQFWSGTRDRISSWPPRGNMSSLVKHLVY